MECEGLRKECNGASLKSAGNFLICGSNLPGYYWRVCINRKKMKCVKLVRLRGTTFTIYTESGVLPEIDSPTCACAIEVSSHQGLFLNIENAEGCPILMVREGCLVDSNVVVTRGYSDLFPILTFTCSYSSGFFLRHSSWYLYSDDGAKGTVTLKQDSEFIAIKKDDVPMEDFSFCSLDTSIDATERKSELINIRVNKLKREREKRKKLMIKYKQLFTTHKEICNSLKLEIEAEYEKLIKIPGDDQNSSILLECDKEGVYIIVLTLFSHTEEKDITVC